MNTLTEAFEELNKLTEDAPNSSQDQNWVKRIQRCIEKGVLDPATLEEFISEYEEELPKKYAIISSDGRSWAPSYRAPYAEVSDNADRPGFLFGSERDAEKALRRIRSNYDEYYWDCNFESQEFEIVEIEN